MVAIHFSRESSHPRDQAQASHIADRVFTCLSPRDRGKGEMLRWLWQGHSCGESRAGEMGFNLGEGADETSGMWRGSRKPRWRAEAQPVDSRGIKIPDITELFSSCPLSRDCAPSRAVAGAADPGALGLGVGDKSAPSLREASPAAGLRPGEAGASSLGCTAPPAQAPGVLGGPMRAELRVGPHLWPRASGPTISLQSL